jgi:hypothetical protein
MMPAFQIPSFNTLVQCRTTKPPLATGKTLASGAYYDLCNMSRNLINPEPSTSSNRWLREGG